tara:strand:- start:7077 stop:7448 length:372 start_codon:yes stop_codon:yes gene_type:complete
VIEMAEIVNMTPHTVNVFENGEQVLAIEPSGEIIRLEESRNTVSSVNGVSVYHQSYADVNGTLPDVKSGVVYIVSMKIATAVPDRTDFVCPGRIVLDSDGNRLGCDGLSSVSGILVLSEGEEE